MRNDHGNRLTALQWTLALVVIAESANFAFSTEAAHFFARTGLPGWFRPALGCAEMLAALLFLWRRTLPIGAYLLVGIFVLAALVHLLHGWWDVGGLIVYTAVALTVVNCREETNVG